MLNGEITITGFDKTSEETEIIIPETIAGLPVTGIGEFAFENCETITGIHLPSSIKTIDGDAFSGCISLTEVTVPDSVTNIGYGAFSNCSNLTSINVGKDNLNYSTSDGNLYSKDKKILLQYTAGKKDSKFTVPDFVTEIESSAFSGCANLTDIVFHNNIKGIWDNAFSDCINITNITLPNGIDYICYTTFSGCKSLESITIPKTVTKIQRKAFLGCANLRTVYYLGTEEEWNSITIAKQNSELKNADVIFVKHTETAVSGDRKTFTVKPVNIAPNGGIVILALYNGENLVDTMIKPYDGSEAVFTTDKTYTGAKIMVWESLADMKIVCNAETL